MTSQPATNPPCIFCATRDTADVTPPQHAKPERVYLCAHCQRRFAVRFIPEPNQPD